MKAHIVGIALGRFNPSGTARLSSLLVLSFGLSIATLGDTQAADVAENERDVLKAGMIINDCADCPEMVVVPAGSFEMGSEHVIFERESPVHRVTLGTFAIGRTEVTQSQWQAVMGSKPSRLDYCGSICPIFKVSWEDAQEFIRRLNAKTGKKYRLPNEAEWEYACRAGSRNEYCGDDNVANVANYFDVTKGHLTQKNRPADAERVAKKASNAWGLHDMSGNLNEWVQDCWHENYDGAPTDGSAWTTGNCEIRVIRGGSWLNLPQNVRATSRFRAHKTEAKSTIGFRLVREIP